MNTGDAARNDAFAPAVSTVALLQRLDLATEVLEGLDELEVHDRDQLVELMERLERQIADEDDCKQSR